MWATISGGTKGGIGGRVTNTSKKDKRSQGTFQLSSDASCFEALLLNRRRTLPSLSSQTELPFLNLVWHASSVGSPFGYNAASEWMGQ